LFTVFEFGVIEAAWNRLALHRVSDAPPTPQKKKELYERHETSSELS
jgi:hypothetical protein